MRVRGGEMGIRRSGRDTKQGHGGVNRWSCTLCTCTELSEDVKPKNKQLNGENEQ